MKISDIDKDFEYIVNYLDNNGFKPYASCDGVEANHENPKEVNYAYVAFLKSPRIISLMAEFLKNKGNFGVSLESEGHFKPIELYGNIISGATYTVNFWNKEGENTHYFEDIIRQIVERQSENSSKEIKTLELIERALEENSYSDLTFRVFLNGGYQPSMKKGGSINELRITTKSGNERTNGNFLIAQERDMDTLASILAKRYNMRKMTDDSDGYPETEFIYSSFDRCSCSVYFTDEHLPQILEQIGYTAQIAHMLPTFESKEWIGSDEELKEEYDDEDWDMD